MKDLILITAYCPDGYRENKLRNLVNSLNPHSQLFDLMVVSHTPIPLDIQNKVSLVIYDKKNEILQEYYQIIFNHSLIKFTEILNKLPFDQSGKYTTLKIEKSDIIACHKDKCIRRNLFEFSSILDKYTPDYIYYKIDVNKQLLHRNYRLDNYQLEKNRLFCLSNGYRQ